MPRIEMERNDSPIDASTAIAGHRCHKMELRAPERASISVLLHWLLWNAHIVSQRMRMQRWFAIINGCERTVYGPMLSLGCSFGDSDFCIHWSSVTSLGI